MRITSVDGLNFYILISIHMYALAMPLIFASFLFSDKNALTCIKTKQKTLWNKFIVRLF